MLETMTVHPILQGGLIVAGIFVVSTILYIGYAAIERLLADRMQRAITDE